MNGPSTKLGATRAVSTSAVAASGAPEMLLASAVIASNPIQSPSAEITCANQRLEYSRDTRTRSRQSRARRVPAGTGIWAPNAPVSVPGCVTLQS